jgi:hypothetical protein
MTDSVEENKDQVLIDLNFVPSWARKPPAESMPVQREFRSEERPRDDRRGPRPGDRPDRPRRDSRDSRDRRAAPGPRPVTDRYTPPARVEPPPPDPRLNAIEVTFLPERRGLAPLAHRLARSIRAYSLFEISALFLSKPDYFTIKLDLLDAAPADQSLCQCSECKAIFLDREPAAVHAFARHFDKVCRKEEKTVEPPKGSFVCVARCTLSGTLLGPPNHHGFNDRVMEIHRLKFSSMPFEAYRKKIENLHDPAAIEAWKAEMTKQVVYHFGEGEKAVSFERFADAEAYFREHCLPGMIREGRHFVMPATDLQGLEDAKLRRLLQECLQNEARFPLKLSITLRLAFRHLGLHTFKSGGGHTFLTAVVPNPMDPANAVPLVREILESIAGHPGCTIQELIAAIRPGLVPVTAAAAPVAAAEAPAEGQTPVEGQPSVAAPTLVEAQTPAEAPVAAPTAAAAPAVVPATAEHNEVTTQLRWMVEKGHVIEFWDGRLAVPRDTVARVQPARPQGHGHGRGGPPREGQPKSKGSGPAPVAPSA